MSAKLKGMTAGILMAVAVLTTGRAEAKDLFFSVGYKAWLNSWTTVLSGQPDSQGVNFQQLSSDPYLASIPNMTLKYKKVFISGSKYSSGEISFPRFTDVFDFDGFGTGTSGDLYNFEYSAERDETDINLGANFYKSLSFTVGYKEVTQKYKVFGYGDPTRVRTFRDESETVYKGFTYGLAGSATLGEGSPTSLYGNFSFGFMGVEYLPEEDQDPSDPDDWATYQSSEVGLAWALGPRGNFTLGYKMQRIATHVTDPTGVDGYEDLGQVATDWTSGVVAGLNLFFY